MSEAGFACPVCGAKMDHIGYNAYACPDGHGQWSPEQGPAPQLLCPICGMAGLPDEPGPDGERICTICGAEVWPPRERYMAPDPGAEARWAWRDEQRYKRALSGPGGGSKSGRKRRKPMPKKPEDWQAE